MYLVQTTDYQVNKIYKKSQIEVEKSTEEDRKIACLRLIMEQFGLKTIKEFANATNLSPNYLSEILNKKKPVPKTLGQKLEDALDVNRQWFDKGIGTMRNTATGARVEGDDVVVTRGQKQIFRIGAPDTALDFQMKALEHIMYEFGFKTTKELADATGLSPNYWSEILNKKKPVPRTLGQVLEDTLGVNRKWFERTEQGTDNFLSDYKKARKAGYQKGFNVMEYRLKESEMKPEEYAEFTGISLEEVLRLLESGDKFELPREIEQKMNRYKQEKGLMDAKPIFLRDPKAYEEEFGEKHWPKLPEGLREGEDRNVFEISYNSFAIITPLVTKENEKQYIESLEDKNALESFPQHCTTLNFPPLGTYRAFEMPDMSMFNHTSPELAIQSIPEHYVVIGRKVNKNFWGHFKDYSKSVWRYVDFQVFIYVTKERVLIRAVRVFDYKSGKVELHPLHNVDRFDKEKIITVNSEDILEIYDVIKKESPYMHPFKY